MLKATETKELIEFDKGEKVTYLLEETGELDG